MKILIIAEPFFGYAERIQKYLQSQNHEVDLLFQFLPNATDRLKRRFAKKEFDQSKYYRNLLKEKIEYDQLLIINGKNIPEYFIAELYKKFKNSKKVLYIWDDFENLGQSQYFFNLFDKIYTYSKFDGEENKNLHYLPFFFSHDIKNENRDIDISFVGSMHSNRYKKLTEIKNANSKLYFYFYLYADVITYLKYFNKIRFRDVQFSTMNYERYIEVLTKSKAHIELPHPTQKNITTRAIEVIGTRTKLITTSNAVKNYEFYDPNNIFIMNDTNLAEIKDWLDIPFHEVSEEIREKYNIEQWINEIMS